MMFKEATKIIGTKHFPPNVVGAVSEVGAVEGWNIFLNRAHQLLQTAVIGNCKCAYHK